MDNERTHDIRRAIEAILLVSDQPVDPSILAQLLETPVAEIDEICEGLRREFEEQGRGFIMHKVAGGWRFQTHIDQAQYVERFVLDGQVARLSAAAMETLAIVAYKQPISRNQVSAIRGVNCDGVARTLESRGYIEEVARDPGPGRAVLYGTTDVFLERLGLASVDELPPLGQFVPNADIVEALETTLMVGAESDVIDLEVSETEAGEAEAAADSETSEIAPAAVAAAASGLIDPFADEEEETRLPAENPAPAAGHSAAGSEEE